MESQLLTVSVEFREREGLFLLPTVLIQTWAHNGTEHTNIYIILRGT